MKEGREFDTTEQVKEDSNPTLKCKLNEEKQQYSKEKETLDISSNISNTVLL